MKNLRTLRDGTYNGNPDLNSNHREALIFKEIFSLKKEGVRFFDSVLKISVKNNVMIDAKISVALAKYSSQNVMVKKGMCDNHSVINIFMSADNVEKNENILSSVAACINVDLSLSHIIELDSILWMPIDDSSHYFDSVEDSFYDEIVLN